MDDRPAEIVIAHDAAALAALAADRIARALAEAAGEAAAADGEAGAEARPVTVALAGGRTPRAVYALLARDRRVPWGRLEIFLGDERCVPPDSEDSNVRMLREAL
ncbi:MAG TPA: 6-phosphogluconolactonase, partial [Planctomycetota bacterium]|nr:6-phosphogluconolactonase [Planctomycetota bacterium]